MTDDLLASRRHTIITLLIVAGVTAVGMQSAPAADGAAATPDSRVWLYLGLIAVQFAWVRYIYVGMRARGRSLREFFGRRWTPAVVAGDLLFAALGYFVANRAGEWLTVILGGASANTAFLLPRSLAERMLWVAVSCTAGLCEETVYRGYLQQQLGRLTGYLPLGVILQAVAFGVSHGYQGYASMLTTGAYGLTLGVLVWWRGNLRSAALAHAATDIIGGLMSTPP